MMHTPAAWSLVNNSTHTQYTRITVNEDWLNGPLLRSRTFEHKLECCESDDVNVPDNSPFVLRAVTKKPRKSGVDPSLALSVTDRQNKKYPQYYFSNLNKQLCEAQLALRTCMKPIWGVFVEKYSNCVIPSNTCVTVCLMYYLIRFQVKTFRMQRHGWKDNQNRFTKLLTSNSCTIG